MEVEARHFRKGRRLHFNIEGRMTEESTTVVQVKASAVGITEHGDRMFRGESWSEGFLMFVGDLAREVEQRESSGLSTLERWAREHRWCQW
jgi:hypothetical protein